MAIEIMLPGSGSAMGDGTVAEWLAKEGDTIVEGAPLFSLASDASTSPVQSPATGTLRIVARTGVTYEAGTVLGYIE